MKRSWLRVLSSFTATGALALVCIVCSAMVSVAQDTPKEIIAAQVRSQGFACNEAVSAERLEAESSPNETVYLLKCESATYRVVLVPDQAAVITKVD